MTNRSRVNARLAEAKVHEDAAGDVLRASVARGKLKSMEGKKKSQDLISKLTARVAAGKRYQTEEAIKKAAAPARKPVKPLTNNPGYGYHGIADRKYKGDTNKAHAEYNIMHAKVKDWAGEAGHLAMSKKPNLMVRDYLDSARGRHLEGLQADEKYIKKDFGHFARSYDPKLFVESIGDNEETLGEDSGDYSGTYEIQSRDGNYRRVRIKRQPSGKYHIHHPDGSKGEWSHDGVKSYISRNNATWMNEETLDETSKSEGALRVQYGVMKRDDYLKKWKIDKYGAQKNRLAGPGGLYKNLLVGSNIDSKSAATRPKIAIKESTAAPIDRATEMCKTLTKHDFFKTKNKNKSNTEIWEHHKSGLVAFIHRDAIGTTIPNGRAHLFSMRTHMVHENHSDSKQLDRAIAGYKHHTTDHFDENGYLNPHKRFINHPNSTHD